MTPAKTNEMNGSCPVRTHTLQSVLGGFVARVTGALVAADHVDALTVPAQPVAQLALIDIWEIIKQRSIFQKHFMGEKNTENTHIYG